MQSNVLSKQRSCTLLWLKRLQFLFSSALVVLFRPSDATSILNIQSMIFPNACRCTNQIGIKVFPSAMCCQKDHTVPLIQFQNDPILDFKNSSWQNNNLKVYQVAVLVVGVFDYTTWYSSADRICPFCPLQHGGDDLDGLNKNGNLNIHVSMTTWKI